MVLVGQGSILQTGPGSIINPGSEYPKGCIEYMRYRKGSDGLTMLVIGGESYSPVNIGDFREVLEQHEVRQLLPLHGYKADDNA